MKTRIAIRMDQSAGAQGFSLVEVLVAITLLAIFVVGTVQFFASAGTRVMDSETRSLMQQIASQEIEDIRALPYGAIGTVSGSPAGDLPDTETKTVEGVPVEITREVILVEDPSYSGPYPGNYRRVTVSVRATDSQGIEPVEVSTIVAGGAAGGTLDVTVTDLAGDPVPDASLQITNDNLSPPVDIHSSAIRTDTQGHLLVPGLEPDSTNSYYVTASKSSYSSASTPDGLVVNEGSPFTVVQLVIDRLSSLTIHLTDGSGLPRSGVSLMVSGALSVDPWASSDTATTDTNGYATLSDLRFGTSLEPYIVQTAGAIDPLLALPSGVDPDPIDPGVSLEAGQIGIILDPGTSRTIELELPGP